MRGVLLAVATVTFAYAAYQYHRADLAEARLHALEQRCAAAPR